MKLKQVKFHGNIYLFGGNSLKESGFIATKEQYENFEASYAHYFPGVGILRYGEKIGECSELSLVNDLPSGNVRHVAPG